MRPQAHALVTDPGEESGCHRICPCDVVDMDRILLIRHGQADGHDGDDPGLSPLGVRQVRMLAARLEGHGITEVLHGPRRRAQQTAETIAQQLARPHRPTDMLEDRTPFPSPQRWDDYPQHRWDFLRDVPEPERDEDGAALNAAWERLSTSSGEGAVVAITHGFVVGSFVGQALGAPSAAWMKLPIDNASITDLRARPTGEWSVAGLNDVGHLRDL